MKIGIYNPRVGTKRAGGTETFLREMMKRINEEIILFTGHGNLLDEVREMDIEVVQVPLLYKEHKVNKFATRSSPVLGAELESLTMYLNAKRTGVWKKMEWCDVLSTHYYLDNLLVSRSLGTPTLFRFPGIKHPSIRWKAMISAGEPDIYLSNSESTMERLQKWFNLSVHSTVYAGVDVQRFTPENSPAFNHDKFVILFVGRIEEGKGIPDLIEAHSTLPDDVFLRIVGDGNRRVEYERKAQATLSDDRYEFVGAVDHSYVHREYAGADVFCLPSYHESFGIVVMEALASGLPTVVSDIDATREYISDGKNGFLIKPGAIEEISDRIRRLKASEQHREKFTEEGRMTALKYSWDRQADKMVAAYRDTVEVAQ